MRVALLARVFPPSIGGIERFTEDLAGWLVGQGHDVAVITRTAAPEGFDGQRPYQVLRGPSQMAAFRSVRRADVAHVKSLSIRDVSLCRLAGQRPVVSHAGHQAICPIGSAFGRDTTCSASAQSPGPCPPCPLQGPRARAAVAAQRAGARLAAANVAVSRYLEHRLGLPRATTIYNPVAAAAFAGGPAEAGEEGLVAFAGRLGPAKGLDLLLRALAHVPDARLEVAGDGPVRERCEALARQLALDHRVRFLGAVGREAVLDLYLRAAVVCISPIWEEPFGYAVAEAMALGRAVVGTPSGALRELLAGGRGFLAQTKRAPDLASALDAALADDGGRAAAGESARRFALDELHVDVVGPRYVSQYQRAGGADGVGPL